MDILSRTKSNVEIKDKTLNSIIKIDDNELKIQDIFKRTFKDNITINDTILPVPSNKLWHKEQAWNLYNNLVSWNKKGNYEKSKFIVKKALKEKGYPEEPQSDWDYPNNTKVLISKEDFFEALDDNFEWKEDDLFSNQIGQLFYEFAAKRHDEKARLGCLNGGFNNEKYIENAPWTILNELFEQLKFKYRFKRDYTFESPNLKEVPMIYAIREDGIIDEKRPRRLQELSDGEKSIISLTFALLNEQNRPMEKLLLLDEFDNTLNPSLIESLFIVLKKFFLDRDTVVVIATHSPVTISLAPEYAKYYELFKQDNSSPKIISVNKNEYTELEIANKIFYEKIINQERRIKSLEKNIEELNAQKIIFVEDTYTQIYKVAWLKLNNIEFNIKNIEKVFEENAPFKIYSKTNKDNLKGFLANLHMDEQKDKKILGLFDFDDAYGCFYDLKTNWSEILGTENECLYKVRTDYPNIYAMLLPVPDYRKKLASKNQTIKRLEIELLFEDEVIESLLGTDYKKEVIFEGFEIPKINNKSSFWKKTVSLEKEKFVAFELLYKRAYELLEIEK